MKQQIFIDDIYLYDYEFLQTESWDLHNLYYSNGDQWDNHIKGMIAISIKDDGNCFTTGLEQSFKTIDYNKAEQLFILLKLINSQAKYEIGTKKLL